MTNDKKATGCVWCMVQYIHDISLISVRRCCMSVLTAFAARHMSLKNPSKFWIGQLIMQSSYFLLLLLLVVAHRVWARCKCRQYSVNVYCQVQNIPVCKWPRVGNYHSVDTLVLLTPHYYLKNQIYPHMIIRRKRKEKQTNKLLARPAKKGFVSVFSLQGNTPALLE